MTNITNLDGIPAGLKDELREVIRQNGPALLRDTWPEDIAPGAITDEQLERLFEICTRNYWSNEIQALRVRRAVESAQASVSEVKDVFSDEVAEDDPATPNFEAE